jgi:predicted metal-dependent hydrolase
MDCILIDITKGIKLFNDGDYFEAHDFFEDIWVKVHDESVYFTRD